MAKVSIIWGDGAVKEMFDALGHEVVLDEISSDVDLVVFTGGEDLNPELYGEKVNGAVGINNKRDSHEVEKYILARAAGLPIVGICRGGQFVHVMNKGKLIQHMPGMSMGLFTSMKNFPALGNNFPQQVKFKKDHHQVIRLHTGHKGRTLYYSTNGGQTVIDVIAYPNTRSLAFQPHPEWDHSPTHNMFFNLIKEMLGVDLMDQPAPAQVPEPEPGPTSFW